jgi:multidrug efflux pump subunit AcrA (membrane-fusion protein)
MIAPVHSVSIVAPYDGYVRKLFVKIGDKVKEGDPLVSISQLAHSKNEELYPVSSPIRGEVVAITKREGESVEHTATNSAQNAILRVDDLSKLYVDCDVAEMDYPKLKIGQSVVIRAAALTGKLYHGRIDAIAQASKAQGMWDRSRVEFAVRVLVSDPDAQLRPGMSTVVDVITREMKDILVLRHEYIWKEKDKDKYYVVTASGEKKDIAVGEQNDEVFEVRSGLTQGVSVKQVDYSAM